MDNQDWRDQIPGVDHMHRLNPHSVQGNMSEIDHEGRKDPRRYYDQVGGAPHSPHHPKEQSTGD